MTTMNTDTQQVEQVEYLLILPVMGDEITMFHQEKFEEAKPCDHPANKAWMTPAFMSLHREYVARAYKPCSVCGYENVPVFRDEFDQRWMPVEIESRGQRMSLFTVDSMKDLKDRGLLEQVYVGGL